VVNPIVPPQFLTEDDRIMDHVNPEYEAWEVQDQTLLVWLQPTLSKSVLSCVLGSNHSYQVWEKIHEHFSLHTKSWARQLRTAMRAVSLEGKKMDEYLHKIKSYVDELAGVGVPIRHEEHVDAILEGLPSDYAPVVSVIESKKHTPSIAEIETLLYGHETRLVRYNRDTQMLAPPSLNYTQGYSSTGSSSFVSPNDFHITFKLNKLLHVPSISKNLLSVSQFAKDNAVFFEFHPHSCSCLVKSQGTNKVLLQGAVGVDGLYSFHSIRLQDHKPQLLSTSSSTANKDSVVSPPSTVNLWHARLGHPNSHVLKLVFDQCNILLSNKMISDFCASCYMGKCHRLSSHSSTSVYSPLELIFTDLWRPSHLTSYSRFKYYVSFVYAFSRYSWIFPIKTKAETTSVFQNFKSSVELQLKTKIKSVQSDWVDEYRPFSALLASYCISHRLICPHTHHQNDVVERKLRHIVDLRLTLLHHATFFFFWKAKIYIIDMNHSSTSEFYLYSFGIMLLSLQFI